MLTWQCYVFSILFLHMQSYRWFALFHTSTFHKLVKLAFNHSADRRILSVRMADRAALLQRICFRLNKWFTVLSLSRSPWYWLSSVVTVHTTAGSMHVEYVQQICVCVRVCLHMFKKTSYVAECIPANPISVTLFSPKAVIFNDPVYFCSWRIY